jgi:hypothetical protein
MNYNQILRNANSTAAEKDAAFSFFIKKHIAVGLVFIAKKSVFMPNYVTDEEKTSVSMYFYKITTETVWQKICNGVLCPLHITHEQWFNALAQSHIIEMDYNSILRNEKSVFALKETAYWFFMDKYETEARQFIRYKLKHLAKETDILYDKTAEMLKKKINEGELCRADKPCEAWFNNIANGYVSNAITAHIALVPANENYAQNEAVEPKPTRFIDFEQWKIKVFKTKNKNTQDAEVEQASDQANLRQLLDSLITEVSQTCKDYFAVFLADEEDLFAWWKYTRSKDQDLNDENNIKKLRSSFDATTSNCRKKMRELIVKHKIKFF